MIFFTILLTLISYGLLFVLAFLLMNIYTDGDTTIDSSSFFYLYQRVYLSNPALLAFYFLGVYWFFATLIAWHKYFVSASMCFWYFQNGEKLKPFERGVKRAWYHLGSAAIDGFLTPVSWLILLIYSVSKVSSSEI
jgi:hypothetical protein